jgi:hypothetical protein
MNETSTPLTAEEARAIDAITSGGTPVAAHTAPADTPVMEEQIEAHFDLPVDVLATETSAASGAEAAVPQDAPYGALHEGTEDDDFLSEEADMLSMRSTMLDSAELANRAAGLAAQSATDMHGAAHKLIAAQSAQRINGIVVLATFGALMLTSMALFGIMSYRLQARIAQADAMLLAVGKRIVSMDESMELITGAGESLRDISSKQDSIVGGQMKLDARLDDIITANQAIAQAAAKPADTKGPDVAKWLQALDTKMQSQASALNALAQQVRATPAPTRPDPAALRREIEAALRQQKAAEAASKPVVITPPAPPLASSPALPPAKPKETLVQYPRAQPQGKGAETP